MSNIACCTLFEGSYHYGVAGLANSLCRQGFSGNLYAGYRGELPEWAAKAEAIEVTGFAGARSLLVGEDSAIVFLPLGTDYHLTNFKPAFMESLFESVLKEEESLIYLDPDIVVDAPMDLIGDWLSCGVGLCEDVNSPLSVQHPRRIGWRRFYREHGIELKAKEVFYANGGLVAIPPAERSFIGLWNAMIEHMNALTGGGQVTRISGGADFKSRGFFHCFDIADQDALNAAVEAFEGDVSFLPQTAMGFRSGKALFPHALGPGKPWDRRHLREALRGKPPRQVDQSFWNYTQSPLPVFSKSVLRRKRFEIALSKAIGRVYRKNS